MKAWSWLRQYLLVIVIVLLLGPFLANLEAVRQVSINVIGLNASQMTRLAADGIALLMAWTMAYHMSRRLFRKTKGVEFLQAVLLPVATFGVVFFANKMFAVHGSTLLDQIGRQRYRWLYTGMLGSAAVWLTVTWIGRWDTLKAFCAGGFPRTRMVDETRLLEGGRSADLLAGTGRERKHAGSTDCVGSTLGRYRIVKELGRGAMGIVYLGKDPMIQRFVAIKTIRLDEVDDSCEIEEVKKRFFREAESTGRLSHPHIVTIYDAGEQNGLVYIAMEYLEGNTLTQWCRRGNLFPVAKAMEIVATVADALDYAHSQGIVHRDIKPSNIMVTKDWLVKVMDFGIARITTSGKTKTSVILGTPGYMSPEQIMGKVVDGRSDTFSLGLVLFELLTGCRPFDADDVTSLLYKIAREPHPVLSQIRPDLPIRAQEIVDRALQKDLASRYRRAGDMAQDLRVCLQHLALSAPAAARA
ncbi:MAG TPA: serine/threonine-protein kinase [Nitrospiraceae bacterium]|jgi:serine/threonine-protein kinase|nr:serine/threonine-protein kinase [Nitrospiraceae bacterium]